MSSENPPLPETPSAASEESKLSPQDKIKRGIKLTDEEKAELRTWREKNPQVPKEEAPVTLDELELANDKILKRIIGGVNKVEAKDLPKMLDIVRTAISEKRSKGEKSKAEEIIKPPTREEMLAKIGGRRATKPE